MTCSPRCEGGWIPLTDATIEKQYPEPDYPTNDPDEATRLRAEWLNARACARNTFYPCPECNRRAFHRWREGHWEPDHDRDECDTCDTPRSRSRRRAKVPARVPTRTPGYVDFTAPKEEPF